MKKIVFHVINLAIGIILFFASWLFLMAMGGSGDKEGAEIFFVVMVIIFIFLLIIWIFGGKNIHRMNVVSKNKILNTLYWFVSVGFIMFVILWMSGTLKDVSNYIEEKRQLTVFPREIQEVYKNEDKSILYMQLNNSYIETTRGEKTEIVVEYWVTDKIKYERENELEKYKLWNNEMGKKIDIYSDIAKKLHKSILIHIKTTSYPYREIDITINNNGEVVNCKLYVSKNSLYKEVCKMQMG